MRNYITNDQNSKPLDDAPDEVIRLAVKKLEINRFVDYAIDCDKSITDEDEKWERNAKFCNVLEVMLNDLGVNGERRLDLWCDLTGRYGRGCGL